MTSEALLAMVVYVLVHDSGLPGAQRFAFKVAALIAISGALFDAVCSLIARAQ